jgi:hypothetical protein
MCVSPVGTPPVALPDDSDVLEYVDLLFGEDLGQLAFKGSDEAAKRELIDSKRLLLVRRDDRDMACLRVLLRLDLIEFKEFVYKVTLTSDPSSESGFQIRGLVLSKQMNHELTFLSGIKFKEYLQAVQRRGLTGLENEEVAIALADLLKRPPESPCPPRSLPLARVNFKNQIFITRLLIEQTGKSQFRITGQAGETKGCGQFILTSILAALTFIKCLKKKSTLNGIY